MSRTFGWIQDGGSFLNLKRVLLSIIPNSQLNQKMREELIPVYVPERYGRSALITAITDENCNIVPYDLFKGSGIINQLTVDENRDMFGYSVEVAQRLVSHGGRANAACTGIAQIATPAQKHLPNGQNKPYQGDWQAECFIRWAISLGFIDYNANLDTCRISDLGRRFATSDSGSPDEKDILGEAMRSYPPACRILELLSTQHHLTKFEIGRQLGFIGEAGFTSVSQSLYIGGLCSASTADEQKSIRQNFEGSSDKYARMIAGWLCQIGWVSKVEKEVTENYLGTPHTAVIGQSYMITQQGQAQINKIKGRAGHSRSIKRVFWNMLATAAPDANYLRNRRYYIIQAIKTTRKSIVEIKSYLSQNGLVVEDSTIIDDLKNLTSIGLDVDERNTGFLLKDEIACLELPLGTVESEPTNNSSFLKDQIRNRLHFVDHRYLVLLDLAYDNNANREFEIETMSLLTDELDYQGLHLGGSRRPDGLFYKGANGVIVDTKAYSNGYRLPIAQADEMVRYIDENRQRGEINGNFWWMNFSASVTCFSFLFVSSEFRGHFVNNLGHIKTRTTYDGGVISAKNLLLFAEKVKSGELNYDESFISLRCNNEVVISSTF